MELYEAKKVLKNNGYLVERTPMSARTMDRFDVPKLSKVNEYKKKKLDDINTLFTNKEVSDYALMNSFHRLFKDVFSFEDGSVYIDGAYQYDDKNSVNVKVMYDYIANTDKIRKFNDNVYEKMLNKCSNLTGIKGTKSKVIFYRNYFIVDVSFNLYNSDMSNSEKIELIKDYKEELRDLYDEAYTKVETILRGFLKSYERAWEEK